MLQLLGKLEADEGSSEAGESSASDKMLALVR